MGFCAHLCLSGPWGTAAAAAWEQGPCGQALWRGRSLSQPQQGARHGGALGLTPAPCPLLSQSAEEGAVSTLYCAVSREVEGITGKYFDSDCSLLLPSDRAQDPGVARKLWDALEQLTGLGNGGILES